MRFSRGSLGCKKKESDVYIIMTSLGICYDLTVKWVEPKVSNQRLVTSGQYNKQYFFC